MQEDQQRTGAGGGVVDPDALVGSVVVIDRPLEGSKLLVGRLGRYRCDGTDLSFRIIGHEFTLLGLENGLGQIAMLAGATLGQRRLSLTNSLAMKPTAEEITDGSRRMRRWPRPETSEKVEPGQAAANVRLSLTHSSRSSGSCNIKTG